jgi:hypothetical protein
MIVWMMKANSLRSLLLVPLLMVAPPATITSLPQPARCESATPLTDYCRAIEGRLKNSLVGNSDFNKPYMVQFKVNSKGRIIYVAPYTHPEKMMTIAKEGSDADVIRLETAITTVRELGNLGPPPKFTDLQVNNKTAEEVKVTDSIVFGCKLSNKPEEVSVFIPAVLSYEYILRQLPKIDWKENKTWLAAFKKSSKAKPEMLLCLAANGQLKRLTLTHSSGIKAQDDTALAAVRKAMPFEAFPDGGPRSMCFWVTLTGYGDKSAGIAPED